MDVNVRVTVDLGDKTMSLFNGFVTANRAVAEAADTAGKVLKKYENEPDETAPEPEKPTRTRRSRRSAEPAQQAPEPEPKPAEDNAPAQGVQAQNSGITLDDVRDLLAEVIEADEENNRPKVMKRLKDMGAKSVSSIPSEEVDGFYDFLQSLRNE